MVIHHPPCVFFLSFESFLCYEIEMLCIISLINVFLTEYELSCVSCDFIVQ